MLYKIFPLLLLPVFGGEYTYGPQLIDNIVVANADLRYSDIHKKMYDDPNHIRNICCYIITSGHQIVSGEGTVIGARIFEGYAKDYDESGAFIKHTIYLPYIINFDKPQEKISFNVANGAIGYLSTGIIYYPKMGSCFGYATSGTMIYKRLKPPDKIHISYKLNIRAKKLGVNELLECMDGEISYSGYFYLKSVKELNIWEGKPGAMYSDEASPNIIQWKFIDPKPSKLSGK